jgi:UDP-GlcNAc:undecaprenyl-phosphate GlcNAc-1-phosphate transferase
MTTIIAIFLAALVLALLITPAVARLGVRLGVVDNPGARKVHRQPIPRIGGLAIYLAFWGAFLPLLVPEIENITNILQDIANEPRMIPLAVGGAVVFVLGLCDDKRGLNPWLKLGVQILAAVIAYWGGIRISNLDLPGIGAVDLGYLALPATVFWILLVINAINLIDGLDGLAAGVSFFACMVLLVLGVIGGRFYLASVTAALAGAILGFLRYNFNPAIIFMGDGGSYFLGFMLANISVIGAVKSQAAASMLIPVIALGVPLLDTVWATVRRFILGRKIFQADREHFHHRLLKLGYSHRKAVLVLYAATIGFGTTALVVVNLQDERAGLILGVVGLAAILGIRRLGYMNYVKGNRLLSWVRELSDDAGLSHERRSFLYEQIQISEAADLDELWRRTTHALELLEFDMAALYLNERHVADREVGGRRSEDGGRRSEVRGRRSEVGKGDERLGEDDRGVVSALRSTVCNRPEAADFVWSRKPLGDRQRFHLRIEMALGGEERQDMGVLVLLKNGESGNLAHYTLKRVEHLRRNVISTMGGILDNGNWVKGFTEDHEGNEMNT